MDNVQLDSAESAGLLATFYVRNALYGTDAAGVQEVIRVDSVTPVRHAPAKVVGVMNLRGRIVTLLDPGQIMGFDRSAITPESRVFIVEDRNEFIGILVDRVSEVIQFDPAQNEPVPANVSPAQAPFLHGICRHNGHVIALLNAPGILGENRS